MMRPRIMLTCAAAVAMAAAVTAGCGGDDDAEPTVNASVATATAKASGATPAPTAPAQPTPGSASPAASPPASGTPTADELAARDILNKVLLGPADIDDPGWTIQSDTSVDNAQAAAADPAQAPLIERCGRLLARTVVNFPPDVVARYLDSKTLSFFSTATVFRDADGATDCAAETATRLTEPGVLARQFGGIFTNPDAVTIAPVAFEDVGDGSFAATLSGQTDANGTVIDLTILIVGFRKGRISAAVGSARSGIAPAAEELRPYVDLTLQRIGENQ